MYHFSRKSFLVLCFINWPNFIVWLFALLKILDSICIVIIWFTVCDVINFQINLSRVPAWPKKSEPKFKHLQNDKSFLGCTAKFQKTFSNVCPTFVNLNTLSLQLKSKKLFISSYRRCSLKIDVLKNSVNFTEKHICWSPFLIKFQDNKDKLKKKKWWLKHLRAEYAP